MNVPLYVQSLLETASYEFDWYTNNPGYAAGYTLAIRKRSDYQTIGTFRKEIERLQGWVNRQKGGEMLILSLPKVMHHCAQHAYVTILQRKGADLSYRVWQGKEIRISSVKLR